MIDEKNWDAFATGVQQFLQEYDKDYTESVSEIAENLKSGNIDDYVKLLNGYAMDLESSVKEEMEKGLLVGINEEPGFFKAVDKINAVEQSVIQLETLSFAIELQQHLLGQDRDFMDSVVTISENIANRDVDAYVERLESYTDKKSQELLARLKDFVAPIKYIMDEYPNIFMKDELPLPDSVIKMHELFWK